MAGVVQMAPVQLVIAKSLGIAKTVYTISDRTTVKHPPAARIHVIKRATQTTPLPPPTTPCPLTLVAMCARSAETSVLTVHAGCHVSWWKAEADRQMSILTCVPPRPHMHG